MKTNLTEVSHTTSYTITIEVSEAEMNRLVDEYDNIDELKLPWVDELVLGVINHREELY